MGNTTRALNSIIKHSNWKISIKFSVFRFSLNSSNGTPTQALMYKSHVIAIMTSKLIKNQCNWKTHKPERFSLLLILKRNVFLGYNDVNGDEWEAPSTRHFWSRRDHKNHEIVPLSKHKWFLHIMDVREICWTCAFLQKQVFAAITRAISWHPWQSYFMNILLWNCETIGSFLHVPLEIHQV